MRTDDPEARIPLWGEPDLLSGKTSRIEELLMRSNLFSGALVLFLFISFLHRHMTNLLPRIRLCPKEEIRYVCSAFPRDSGGYLSL